jgi:hypothetical protein
VFSKTRRAKQGHNAIAHDLVHGPFVAVHSHYQALEYGIEELACLLRIAVGQERQRGFEIGEEYRHVFALAFQRTAGRQNLLGAVIGLRIRLQKENRLRVLGSAEAHQCLGIGNVPR